MKFLITGATGFIGNHLINELLKDSGNEIIATSRDITKAKKYKWFNRVRYIEYSICLNDIDIDLYTLFEKPDCLIHLSWEGLPHYDSLIHIEKNIYHNYSFIKNLVQNGLKNISLAGTCMEYGMLNGELYEDTNTQPSNSYAIAKDTLRIFLEELNKNFDFQLKWIRLFYMYGEGQSEKSLLSQVDNTIKNAEASFNMSFGEQLRDYLPISEVISNIILISKQDKVLGCINCCSNKPISVRHLVENYLKEKNYSLKLNLGYYPYSKLEPMYFWGNNSKLKLIKEEYE